MQGFEFSCPTKIVCGEGALAKVPAELSINQIERPLVVTDAGLMKLGIAQKLLSILENAHITYELFDSVPPDSSLAIVNEVSALYEKEACDGFIALGGGSVIDTTKGAAASLSCEGVDFATLQGSEILTNVLPPLIAIPTTAGTGSEVTLVAVVADKDKHTKLSFTSYQLVPKVAILDPSLTLSLPPRLTATTGMDALTHAIEAYTSIQKNPLSDAFAKSAIELIRDSIFVACSRGDDKEARTALALGSLMAGAAFSNSMVGIVHAIGHSLGGICHVPHGQAMMILLPFCVDFNIAHNHHRPLYAELFQIFEEQEYRDTPEELRDKAFARLLHAMNERFNQEYGVPIRLRDVGVEQTQLEEVALQARYDGAALYNQGEIRIEDARAILEAAY